MRKKGWGSTYRPVVLGYSDTTTNTMVNTTNLERGEDGVGAGRAGEDEGSEQLHVVRRVRVLMIS